MATRFDLGFVHASNNDELILVGFADREHGTVHHVLLQRSADPDEDDGEVHIEVDDQGRSAFGGIRAVIAHPGRIQILVEPTTARELQTDEELDIRFPGVALDDNLVENLTLLLGGTPATLTVLS